MNSTHTGTILLCALVFGADALAQNVPAVSTQEPAAVRNLRVIPPPSANVSSAQEEANKRIVLQWHYEFFDLGNFEEASNKYMAEDFMQNDPREPSGRGKYVSNFKSNGYMPKPPDQRPPLLAVFAQGDLVMTVIPEEWPKPAGAAAEAGAIHCNMYRLKNGRIIAMWVSGGGGTPARAATPMAQTPPPTMRAAVPDGDTLALKQVPTPVPAAGQVLIRVRASSANPVDWRVFRAPAGAGGPPGGPPRSGAAGPPGGRPGGAPMMSNANNVPGFDAAGEIAVLGPGVTNWKVGDAVVAFLDGRGAYAQYAVASVDAMARKSTKLSFEEAAGIPTVASAAWAVLEDIAHVRSGQRVLVHGGAGGVGSAAVQIAKAKGAYVIATASSSNHAYLRSIGADETIDYTTQRLEDRVKDVDIVVNTADAETANRSVPLIKKGGMLVSVAGQADAEKCAAAGITCSGRRREGATPIGEVLAQIMALADAGKYRVNVEKAFPLADAGKAWEQGRGGHTRGKLIIAIPD